jgi:hypothetical protein
MIVIRHQNVTCIVAQEIVSRRCEQHHPAAGCGAEIPQETEC